MARKVAVQIPKDLGLTKKELSTLEKSFKKKLVDTLKAKPGPSKVRDFAIIVRAVEPEKS